MCASEAISGIKNRFAEIVGTGDIIDDAATLESYTSDISFVGGCKPLLLVYPGSRDQVKAIVSLAVETGTPLVPVSSGPPRFRGDTVPGRDAIIVNFSRMNHILKIDPVNRYTMIEPGVTYGELIPELNKQGLRLNAPLLPRASKSVVTSRLEREPTLIPKYQYDYIDPLLTLEVVYGNGDDFRTGSASGPGTLETLKADKVNPWGPGSVDFFRFVSGAQGTMGLVTWAVIKAEVLPQIQKLYFIPFDNEAALTAPVNGLLRKRVVDECLALNNVDLAAVLAETWPEDFEELKRNLPAWTVIACVAGYERRPEERIAVQEAHLQDICKDLGVKPQATLPGAEGRENRVRELLNGVWDKEPYWKLRNKDACHDIFFLSPLSRVPVFTRLMKEVMARCGYSGNDIGCYIQPMVQGRGCHCEFNIPCDSSNAGEVAAIKKLVTDASQTFMQNGAFFSRPYGPWADMVYSRDAESVAALRKLKAIFDPDSILNPGKLCF